MTTDEQKHTPTPWPSSGRVAFTKGVHVVDINYERAAVCVEACEGMPDPAAEIARLREAADDLRGLRTVLQAANKNSERRGAERDRLREANAELVQGLKESVRQYVNLLDACRDRIIDAGGQCDSVTTMEQGDPHLRDARALLAKHSAHGQEKGG